MRSLLLGFLVFIGASAPAWPCSCSQPEFVERFIEDDLIFEGKAIKTEPYTPRHPSQKHRAIGVGVTTFDVTRAIKGFGPETRRIVHATKSITSCPAVWFSEGRTYRVFATHRDGEFSTAFCMGNSALDTDRQESLESVIDSLRDATTRNSQEGAAYNLYRVMRTADDEKFVESYIRRTDFSSAEQSGRSIRDGIEKAKKWGDQERVLEGYRKLSRTEPFDPAGSEKAGQLYVDLGRYEEAIPYLEIALSLDPGNKRTQTNLAKADFAVTGSLAALHTEYQELKLVTLNLEGRRKRAIDFSGSKFIEVNFDDASLSKLRFRNVKFEVGSFRNSNLTAAQFHGTQGPVFHPANMADIDPIWALNAIRHSRSNETEEAPKFLIDFSDAVLRGASLVLTSFDFSDFRGADLQDVEAPAASFTDSDFREAKVENAVLIGGRFQRSDLRGIEFKNVNLSFALFRNARLQNADLRKAILDRANFTGARFSCTTLVPPEFSFFEKNVIAIEPECSRQEKLRDFSNKEWRATDFSGLDLSNANFSNANLARAKFFLTNLSGSDFSNSDGAGNFAGADLTNASFAGATELGPFHTQLVEIRDIPEIGPAKLQNTDFSGAVLRSSDLIGSPYTGIEEGVDVSGGIFRQASLSCDNEYYLDHIKEVDENGFNISSGYSEELKKSIQESKEERYQLYVHWIGTEKSLVRQLAAKWPSMKFDKECQVYLAED